jgi:hypothetical protein
MTETPAVTTFKHRQEGLAASFAQADAMGLCQWPVTSKLFPLRGRSAIRLAGLPPH